MSGIEPKIVCDCGNISLLDATKCPKCGIVFDEGKKKLICPDCGAIRQIRTDIQPSPSNPIPIPQPNCKNCGYKFPTKES